MSIAKGALLLDLQYTTWADQRVLDACCELTAEEMDRDLHNSHQKRHLHTATYVRR
jgi:hypothetical protein